MAKFLTQPRMLESATAVAQIANQEAMRLGDGFIGTEHILVGLATDQGIAGNALREQGAQTDAIQQALNNRPRIDAAAQAAQLGRGKDVLGRAFEEARQLHHLYVGPEHLLLGVLGDSHCLACQLLVDLGVNLEQLRTTILDRLSAGSPAEIERLKSLEVHFAKEPRVEALKEQLTQLQVNKEQAVAAADFPGARSFLDQQRAVEKDLERLYEELDRQSDSA